MKQTLSHREPHMLRKLPDNVLAIYPHEGLIHDEHVQPEAYPKAQVPRLKGAKGPWSQVHH